MEHDQVELEVFEEVEFHFREFGVVCWESTITEFCEKGLAVGIADITLRTGESSSCFTDDTLDMNRCFIDFGRNIDATCSQHERVRFAQGIVQVEPLEVDVCCCDRYLPEHELLAETVDEVGKEDRDGG